MRCKRDFLVSFAFKSKDGHGYGSLVLTATNGAIRACDIDDVYRTIRTSEGWPDDQPVTVLSISPLGDGEEVTQ